VNPQLWDGSFCSIFLFRINEYLEGDAKNIICSLYRIATFIRQRKLKDKTVENIPQIVEFGFTTWDFISFIYKSEWNKLNVSGMVHTRVEVYRMNLEMSRLAERPWLQPICCAVCLPCGRNFR